MFQRIRKGLTAAMVLLFLFAGISGTAAEETDLGRMCFGVSYAALLTNDEADDVLYANYEPAFGTKIALFFSDNFGIVLGGEFHSNMLNDNSFYINGVRQNRMTYIGKAGPAFRFGPVTLYPMGGYGMGSPITRYEGSFLYIGAGFDIVVRRNGNRATGIYVEYGNCSGTYSLQDDIYFTDGYPEEKELTSQALVIGVSSHF